MDLADLAGLSGAFLILLAYAGTSIGRLDPLKAPAMVLNLAGALLVLYSLIYDFNLAAALLEAAWAIIAIGGLIRLALKRRA